MHLILPPALRSTPKPPSTTRRDRRLSLAACLGWSCVLSLAAVSSARADEVDDYVGTQMSRQHIPGLSLAVLKDGKPVKMQGYGVANLELATPATPETVYQIGSVSKQFIAAGIVCLCAEGKVGLDDSIRKYLEDAPEIWQPITLRHLLTHTSGLVRETPGLQLKAQSEIDALRAAYATPLAFQPGEKWQYSNLGYFALAEVISRAAQIPWSQYLQERIFGPLGMNATRTTTVEELVPHRAGGYQWLDTQRYQNSPVVPGVRPSGAFLSSVRDLAQWDAALYSDALFSPQQRELLWTPVKLNDGTEKPYGFGWETGKTGKHRHVKHGGTMLGFRSQLLRFPDDRLTVVVLTNATQVVVEKIALSVAAFYLPDLKPSQPKRNTVPLPKEILDGYAGRYRVAGDRVLAVARRGNQLTITMPLGPALGKEIGPLVQGVSMDIALVTPENETRFFDEDDPRSTYVFSKTADGKIQFAVENAEGKTLQKATKIDS